MLYLFTNCSFKFTIITVAIKEVFFRISSFTITMIALLDISSVSYTHLDVYKRQLQFRAVCETLFDSV